MAADVAVPNTPEMFRYRYQDLKFVEMEVTYMKLISFVSVDGDGGKIQARFEDSANIQKIEKETLGERVALFHSGPENFQLHVNPSTASVLQRRQHIAHRTL
ncbi:hypothetical protein F2P81_004104 [Scophthalmus maximus]|uniref:Uncharacterized protein n=1 Tax=Scophthalmus maximus TaxID=52904 RepID=A0A6A4T8U1_SCOMX|nr:hypothetical protein F2P81_004104 [Scophthalmus maximus]